MEWTSFCYHAIWTECFSLKKNVWTPTISMLSRIKIKCFRVALAIEKDWSSIWTGGKISRYILEKGLRTENDRQSGREEAALCGQSSHKQVRGRGSVPPRALPPPSDPLPHPGLASGLPLQGHTGTSNRGFCLLTWLHNRASPWPFP